MNKPIGYNLAKLCNEKGLPGVSHFYTCKKHYALNSNKYTFADLVMWLYETHDIWISVERHEPKALFNYVIIYHDKISNKESRGTGYNTPTEAYIEAIEYALKGAMLVS